MSIASVEFDLLCLKPNEAQPVYRLWVNNTLMTERVFRWNTQEKYLRERIVLDIEEREKYDIKIEKISGLGEFVVEKMIAYDERNRDLRSNFSVIV